MKNVLKDMLVGVLCGVGLVMSLWLAYPAKADVTQYTYAVCSTLAQYPTFAGIDGVMTFLTAHEGMSIHDAAVELVSDVASGCPRFNSLLSAYGNQSGTGGQTA